MNLDAQEAALGLLGLSPTNLTITTSTSILRSPTSTVPTKRKQRDDADTAGEAIDCICGFDVDDGFSIACDLCSRWCHSACFDVAPEEIPDQFKCWTCKPRPASFKDRAVRMQKDKLEMGGLEKQRRKTSPGVERKQRRVSIDKRKRRPSVVNEDEHVDIDEPWSQSYVHISQDIISDDDTRIKLRRHAQHWRGVTAVADSSPSVKELPLSALSPYSNPHILPPAYSLHTTTPITSNRLITDYKSSITPSASYLSDPLNAYAHLGMPKPFVHLLGPPLDVALDSRLAGNQSRFARSGCRPNAVLRPLLCDDSDKLGFGVFALRDLKANEEVVLGWEWDDGNAVHNLPALLKTPHIFPPRQIQHLRHQMSNILHALSSTFTTCACGARTQDCAINRMATFVDGTPTQDDQREQPVDLGPLVGRKRGFKTKERIPFSGGMGGMVMCKDDETSPTQPLPAFLLSPSSPTLYERSAKGKERAVNGDEDIEMADLHDKSVGRVSEMNSQASKSIPPEPLQTSLQSPNRLKSHPTFDLRPPDPGGPSQQPENEDSMPPKMRKKWMHRELEALRELNGNTNSPSSTNHNYIVRLSQSPGSSSAGGISPTLLPSKLAKRSGNNGYGHERLQFENRCLEDHEWRYPEDDMATNVHPRPASMPPPPMPAFLDPTTISSAKSSLNVIQPQSAAVTTRIAPSISPLTSFANLSLLSPALLGSTPPPSLPFPFPAPPNSRPAAAGIILSKDHAATWSPLRRHMAPLPPISPSVLHAPDNDTASIASSSPSPINPSNDMDDDPIQYSPSPSPPPSLSSFHPVVDTNTEIQSTPHSPDPTWRADSPSGDHVNPAIESDIHTPNHNSPSELPVEMLMKGLEEVHKKEYWESPPVFGGGGRSMDYSSCPPSPSSSSRDATAIVVYSSRGDEQEDSTAEISHHMDLNQSNDGTSLARLESSPLNKVPSHDEPLSTSLPQPLLLHSTTPSAPQHNPTTEVVKDEGDPKLESSPERHSSPPPPPKVKMSLRDFALRKKKQREEQEMTKSIQHSSSEGRDLSFNGSEQGEDDENQAYPVDRKVHEGSSNGKAVTDRVVQVVSEWEKDSADVLKREGTASLSRPMVKDEVVDMPGSSWIKPTTTNGHHKQHPQTSIPLSHSSASRAACIQTSAPPLFPYSGATSRQTKQELIEQPIPTTTSTAIQPTSVDATRYAAMYNNSRSISPINPDPHLFQSSSPPRLYQEDGEIGEIKDTPPPLSSSTHFLPVAFPEVNQTASVVATVPSGTTPIPRGPSRSIPGPVPRGPTAKRPDAFTRSSQVRHSPPTHPRSFNASPPYRPIQQPPSTSNPPPGRGTGIPPPTAPRALRQSMLSNRAAATTLTSSPSSYPPTIASSTTLAATPAPATTITTTTTNGQFPPYIPRGPSADRDRGWDIESTQYARPLLRRDSREGGHAWGGR